MKVAVIGSRSLTVPDLGDYLPEETTELVSGGAKGVDASARAYAQAHGLALREFLPDYARYRASAPLRRNRQIVEYADYVLAFWDGQSRGTMHSIQCCAELNVPYRLVRLAGEENKAP